MRGCLYIKSEGVLIHVHEHTCMYVDVSVGRCAHSEGVRCEGCDESEGVPTVRV